MPELRVVTDIRYDPSQKTAVDVLDFYVRYRPVSTSRWRWSVKGGAFFPPISLENTMPGWGTEWTITPSAINAWAGEELRIFGGEATLEWRGDVDHIALTASVFGLNQAAGTGIASYGWTLADRPTGLLDHIRLAGGEHGLSPPQYSDPFRHFDHSAGWYGGVAWERADIGRIALLRYDNQADPAAHDAMDSGWRTEFWSLGLSSDIGPVTILSQAMVGSTVAAPLPGYKSTTRFWAWYVLAALERDQWRFALRFDQFGTREAASEEGPKGDETGVSGTVAATWSPSKHVSLVGEVLAADYSRPQRVLLGKSPHVTELQAQLALRLKF